MSINTNIYIRLQQHQSHIYTDNYIHKLMSIHHYTHHHIQLVLANTLYIINTLSLCISQYIMYYQYIMYMYYPIHYVLSIHYHYVLANTLCITQYIMYYQYIIDNALATAVNTDYVTHDTTCWHISHHANRPSIGADYW